MSTTKLLAPESVEIVPYGDLTDQRLMNKLQSAEQAQDIADAAIAGSALEPVIVADVVKVAGGSGGTTMVQIGDSIHGAGYSSATNKIFGHARTDIHDPVRLSMFENISPIKDIAVGQTHSLVVLENGDLYTCGGNDYGQCGLGSTFATTDQYEKVTGPWGGTAIVKCWAGHHQSFVCSANGDVYATGLNTGGQLGVGDTVNKSSFTIIASSNDLFPNPHTFDESEMEIAVGFDSTMLMVLNLDLWASGQNANGQLGQGDTSALNEFTPCTTWSAPFGNPQKIVASFQSFGILDVGGNVHFCGLNTNNFWGHSAGAAVNHTITHLTALGSIIDIASGFYTDVGTDYTTITCLRASGVITSCGNNTYGALGNLGATSTNYVDIPASVFTGDTIIAVFGGGLTRYALDSGGNMWVWGHNTLGQCFLGSDYPIDDDSPNIPLPSTYINDARLIQTFRDIDRGYSHAVIPQIVQQSVIQGGGGDYEYEPVTGHSIVGFVTETKSGTVVDDVQVYTLAGFTGGGLTGSEAIRKIYVRCESSMRGDGSSDADHSLEVLYPDGSAKVPFHYRQLNAFNDEIVEHQDLITIPIGIGQTEFSIRSLIIDGNNEAEDWLKYTIVGVEVYVANPVKDKFYIIEEKTDPAVQGTTLLANDWRDIPFTDDVRASEIPGASFSGAEITVPIGRFRLNLMLTLTGLSNVWWTYAYLRLWNVTDGVLIENLPNLAPATIIDYYGSGHFVGGGTFESIIDIAAPKVIKYQTHCPTNLITGNKVTSNLFDNHYSRLLIEGK